ncbi:MAG: STAS domain-containing protein [Actinobacteria bacterium]|nr:STAS domain-containing protein [Actinomycetota bacterium]
MRSAVKTEYLSVQVDRYGLMCVLTVHGELDCGSVKTFTEFTDGVAAMTPQPRRIVLDLSGLRFADCAGARALAAVARAQPGRCPVVVRSVRPAVRRVLDLMAVDVDLLGPQLELMSLDVPWRGGARAVAGSPTGELVWRLRAARSHSEQAIADCRRVAESLAETEDKMAATLLQLAARRPRRSRQLATLSQAAREQAVRMRDQARHALPH